MTIQVNKKFLMSGTIIAEWDSIKKYNPHYCAADGTFNGDEAVQQVIKDTEDYTRAFENGDGAYLKQAEIKALGGREGYAIGVNVDSPWGDNAVVNVGHEGGIDICIKDITVKPGFMLSLQKHRGRKERWEVSEGTLSLIMDGNIYDVSPNGVYLDVDGDMEIISDNNYIDLPKGSVHCMINRSFKPVKVRETQSGITREADNIRLGGDFTGRPTYPLTNEMEFKSAILYAKIHAGLLRTHKHVYEAMGSDAKGKPVPVPPALLAA